MTDISSRPEDALFGDGWLQFLLDCKYTIGVEGGSSVFDRDGSIVRRTREYLRRHGDSSFEDVEAACFPGMDGQFEYRLIGPRHLEAAITRTCQVLIEGYYNGVLVPGVHYLELKRDFSNIDQVLEIVREDDLRAGLVQRAYDDVVASGKYSYGAYAEVLFTAMLGVCRPPVHRHLRELSRPRLAWNRIDERLWVSGELAIARARGHWLRMRDSLPRLLRPVASRLLGEERLKKTLAGIRSRRP